MRFPSTLSPWLIGVVIALALPACASRDPHQGTTGAKSETIRAKDTMRQATVLVENGGAHGTGIIIASNWVLTAHHIVDDGDPEIVFFHGQREKARVHWVNEDLDLAFVEVKVPAEYDAPSLNCTVLRGRQLLVAVGHPTTARWVAVEGYLDGVDRLESTRLQPLGFPLSLGNSGGPVFDRNGAVAGIVSAILVEQQRLDIDARTGVARNNPQSGIGAMVPASEFCAAARSVLENLKPSDPAYLSL